MGDRDNLTGPPNSGYVNRTLRVMENKSTPIEDKGKPGQKRAVTITWDVDLHIQPSGAYLDPKGLQANKDSWNKDGEVHVVLVHKGTIEQPKPFWPDSYKLTSKIRNPGARARDALPTSGVENGSQTTYKIEWEKSMDIYSGQKKERHQPSFRQSFTRSDKSKQEGKASGQETVHTIVLNTSNDAAKKATIYGLSHFTLKAGDYKDVYLEFTFAASEGGAGISAGIFGIINPVAGAVLHKEKIGKWHNETPYSTDPIGTKLTPVNGYDSYLQAYED